MPKGKDIVQLASLQIGKAYIFGAEDEGNPNPKAFDCSELVQWVCEQLKVNPAMVDGAVNQLAHCQHHGLTITVDESRRIPGALVFMRDPDTKRIHHVAISDGMGNTVEARGKDFGVGRWSWRKGFTDAGKIPGVDYGA